MIPKLHLNCKSFYLFDFNFSLLAQQTHTYTRTHTHAELDLPTTLYCLTRPWAPFKPPSVQLELHFIPQPIIELSSWRQQMISTYAVLSLVTSPHLPLSLSLLSSVPFFTSLDCPSSHRAVKPFRHLLFSSFCRRRHCRWSFSLVTSLHVHSFPFLLVFLFFLFSFV